MENFHGTLKNCENRESLAQQIFSIYGIPFGLQHLKQISEFSEALFPFHFTGWLSCQLCMPDGS